MSTQTAAAVIGPRRSVFNPNPEIYFSQIHKSERVYNSIFFVPSSNQASLTVVCKNVQVLWTLTVYDDNRNE